MSGLKFPVGSLVPLGQRSSPRDMAQKSPPGNCAAAAATNMTRRKSLSVSDISSLSLSPGGRGPRQRVPENELGRQSKSAQSSQSSLLGAAGVREAGGRSLGGSIGDLMNSGEFRPGAAGWSPRTCSPITLSMVSEASHRSAECLDAPPPAISLDEPDTDAHDQAATRGAAATLHQDLDSCRSTTSLCASPGSFSDLRLEADDGGGGGGASRSPQRSGRRLEHKVTIAVDAPQPREAPPQAAAPSHRPAHPEEQQQQEDRDEDEEEPQMRAGRPGLRRSSKKMSMVERTQHLALLIHDQQKRRRGVVVLPVSYPPP